MSSAHQPGTAPGGQARASGPAGDQDRRPAQDEAGPWPGAAPPARWMLRAAGKQDAAGEPAAAAPAIAEPGPSSAGLLEQAGNWYGPGGAVHAWDDAGWQPAREHLAARLPRQRLPPETRLPARRGRGVTALVPAAVLAAVAALALALITGHGPMPRPAAPAGLAGRAEPPGTITLPGYPGEQRRGVFQAVSRIVAAGPAVVATGSVITDGIARQQFITSADGGRTWHLAPARTPGGRQAPPGYTAPLLAGGPHGWLAEGPHAIWTSRDGRSWTLAATHGITPQEPGDSVWVITRTARGFLAAGSGTHGRGHPQAVIWTSPDGLRWHRADAARAGLAGPGETVLNIAYASWRGNATVISGDIARGRATYDGAWLSTDGGITWTRVTIPADHGSTDQVSGLAADSAGLIAVRPAAGDAGAVTYFSPDGRAWQYTATLGADAGWNPGVVKGSSYGFVVTGTTAAGQITAYTSTGAGRGWLPTAPLGDAAAETVGSATMLPGGAAAAVGSTAPGKLGQQPVFLEASPAGTVRQVTVPGAVPETAVRAAAAGGGQQIAVGSANGFPAVWRKTPGRAWQLMSPPGPAAADPALRSLTGVTRGPAGWLAVGAPGPVVLTSPDGLRWRTAPGGITQDLAGVGAVAAAAGPGGYVITGKLVGPGGTCVADVWWSPDLTRWTRAHDVNLAAGSSQVLAVAAGQHGFVSAGSHQGRPAVWITADGVSWKTIVLPLPAGASAAVLQQVAVKGNRVAALGQATTAAGPAPLAEVSADGGTTWRQAPISAPGPDPQFTALTAGPAGFTAAGQASGPGGPGAALWTSATGGSWKPSPAIGGPGPETWQILALALSGNTVTAIAGMATNEGEQFIARRT